MPKNWYLVNIAGNFFSNQPQLKGTVLCMKSIEAKKSPVRKFALSRYTLEKKPEKTGCDIGRYVGLNQRCYLENGD